MDTPKYTWFDTLKFILVAGVGFFTDGYINFVISLIVPVLGYLYYPPENTVPARLGDVIKGSASIGMILGQVLFGILGDAFGRRNVYGKELLFTIFGTIMVVVFPPQLSPHHMVVWVSVFRAITGFGIGGDYPMSSTLSVEKNQRGHRSDLIIAVFASLGVGTFIAGIMFLILLGGFRRRITDDIDNLQYVWRLVLALGTVPGLLTLYARLKMAETQPYEKFVGKSGLRSHMTEVKSYFGEWRHLKVILATASIWFLFDVAFYGVNFNQSTILSSIGYGDGNTPWETLHNLAVGNILVCALGFLPGYYFAIPLFRVMGRVQHQILGCFIVAVLYAVWAGVTIRHPLLKTVFPQCWAFCNHILIPVDVFPTSVRASAHGISAASGKAGAVLASFAFGTVVEKIGLRSVLGLFCGIMALCSIISFLIPETEGKTIDEIEEGLLFESPKLGAKPRKTAIFSSNSSLEAKLDMESNST